ncbi:MAG TPA: hypothetical protein VJR03_07980 [Nitrospira sp.]|nr:hypothetical protein [Nitrospira sp.]
MNAVTNWLKGATLIFGIVGLFLLWEYGDALLQADAKTETVTGGKDKRFARCGLGFLILAIGLYLVTSFL